MTPVELLETRLVLSMDELASVVGLTHRYGNQEGKPDRRLARELIRQGRLRLVDPSQPPRRWTVSVAAVRKYLQIDPGPVDMSRYVPPRGGAA